MIAPRFALLSIALWVATGGPTNAASPATASLHDPGFAASLIAAPWAEPRTPAGWQLQWTKGEGRRELSQAWIAADDRPLNGLAFELRSGTKARLEDARIRLTVFAAEDAPVAQPSGERLFDADLLLPPNSGPNLHRGGRWLVLPLPGLPQQTGRRYVLQLAFATETEAPQQIVFSLAPLDRANRDFASGYSSDGATWQWWRRDQQSGALVMSVLHTPPERFPAAADSAPRRLIVDPRDPRSLPTLKAAADQARPGDTVWLARGSGPYREALHIARSGTADAPIIVEGNDNEITGFDPITFAPGDDGRPRATLTPDYPFVLRHDGRRILEDPATGDFSDGPRYDPDTRVLTLAPGAPTTGWEVSARPFAVRVHNVSHHLYRNLVASGSRNDGFNLHGSGANLVFENITGRDNLDEGFSAHDEMRSEIKGGNFFGNDNGIYNVQDSATRIRFVDIHANLGIGLYARDASIEAENVRVWGNGLMQAALGGAGAIRGQNITVFRNPFPARPWRTHMETSRWTQAPATVNAPLRAAAAAAGVELPPRESPDGP